MSEEGRKKSVSFFPIINPKSPWSSQAYLKSVQDAPYHALIGVVTDGRDPDEPPEFPRYRVRCQTGLTNRWRQPQSLYSDMLGSSQALKAINLPFNQNLVNTFKYTYPSMNPMLLTCQEFADINEKNWSLLRRQRAHKAAPEEEEEEHVPA